MSPYLMDIPGAAIQFAYDNVILPSARNNVRVTMVVITDGFSFDNVHCVSFCKNRSILKDSAFFFIISTMPSCF